MIENESFEDKPILLSVLAFLYYDKTKNIDKSYEIIKYAKPMNIFIYLNHKINLTYLKIQKLLKKNNRNETERCFHRMFGNK